MSAAVRRGRATPLQGACRHRTRRAGRQPSHTGIGQEPRHGQLQRPVLTPVSLAQPVGHPQPGAIGHHTRCHPCPAKRRRRGQRFLTQAMFGQPLLAACADTRRAAGGVVRTRRRGTPAAPTADYPQAATAPSFPIPPRLGQERRVNQRHDRLGVHTGADRPPPRGRAAAAARATASRSTLTAASHPAAAATRPGPPQPGLLVILAAECRTAVMAKAGSRCRPEEGLAWLLGYGQLCSKRLL